MQLKYLELGCPYSAPSAVMKGKVLFHGNQGEILLNLDAKGCSRVLEVLADELVRQSKELAQNLTTEAITSMSHRLEDLS